MTQDPMFTEGVDFTRGRHASELAAEERQMLRRRLAKVARGITRRTRREQGVAEQVELPW